MAASRPASRSAQLSLDGSLIGVGVPAVVTEHADAWALRRRHEPGGGVGGFRELPVEPHRLGLDWCMELG